MTTQTITKHLRLPFQFDKVKLRNELEVLLEQNWIPHFNTGGYSGDWKSIPLYTPDGNSDNIFAFQANNNAPLKATQDLLQSPYLSEVISSFKCELLSVRLLRLSPGSRIKPHRDHNLGYEDGCFRLHIPITTNPGVRFILDEVDLNMKEGSCWYTNVNYTHSVRNEGNTDRVHLVIDGQRNAWSDELFFSLVPKESLLQREKVTHDLRTIQLMIAELENQDSEGAQILLKELKREVL